MREHRPVEFQSAPDIVISDRNNYLMDAKFLVWTYLLKKAIQPSSGFHVCCPSILTLLGILQAVDSTGNADYDKVFAFNFSFQFNVSPKIEMSFTVMCLPVH